MGCHPRVVAELLRQVGTGVCVGVVVAAVAVHDRVNVNVRVVVQPLWRPTIRITN